MLFFFILEEAQKMMEKFKVENDHLTEHLEQEVKLEDGIERIFATIRLTILVTM